MRRLPFSATLAVALVAAVLYTSRAWGGDDLAAKLLNGSFRGAALRGLLPERVLDGRDEPEAYADGDLDGRGGPELAVVWRGLDALNLTVLTEKPNGGWTQMAEFRRELAGVRRLEFLTVAGGSAQPLLVHWLTGGPTGEGQVEVFACPRDGGPLSSVFKTRASHYRLEDVDENHRRALIVSSDTATSIGIPRVFQWTGETFAMPVRQLHDFYAAQARRFQAEGERAARLTPRGQPASLSALDNLLNAAKCLETAGKKVDSFRAYRRVASLGRSGLMRARKPDVQQQLRDARILEARDGMARLLGRPSPSLAVPSPVRSTSTTTSTTGMAATTATTG
ncbi:MAG: hypothetical protein HY814_02935 [Candidatus Riflebacteria bacterium]|nr:hypothetical protein [Candidatus Riflebacteria bacterium]